MINERIDTIRIAGGEAVQVRFDLPDPDLLAISQCLSATVAERYRGVALDADAVLELRDLVALQEAAHERAQDGYAGGTLVVSVRRLGLLVQAIEDHQALARLAGELDDLHRRALALAIATRELATA
jgi:hypothetical protein